MPEPVRISVIALLLTFVAVGGYYRIQPQHSGEKLDRTQEGWPLLIGIRPAGLLTAGSTLGYLAKPAWFSWAAYPVPGTVRWVGGGSRRQCRLVDLDVSLLGAQPD